MFKRTLIVTCSKSQLHYAFNAFQEFILNKMFEIKGRFKFTAEYYNFCLNGFVMDIYFIILKTALCLHFHSDVLYMSGVVRKVKYLSSL